jgi:hypothetical protein
MNVPSIVSACADCGVGTITLGEWYMVNADVWEGANDEAGSARTGRPKLKYAS